MSTLFSVYAIENVSTRLCVIMDGIARFIPILNAGRKNNQLFDRYGHCNMLCA